jgi:two-component system sensor histidine kinase DesK
MNKRSPLGQQWWALGFSIPGCLILIEPLQRHASRTEIALSIAGCVVFIALFASVLHAWNRGRSGLWQTIGIMLLGAAFAPTNYTAWVFFAIAAAFTAWVAEGNVRRIVLMVAGIVAFAAAETWLLHLPMSFLGAIVVCSIPTVAIATLTLRRAIAVRDLARHTERDRIARDMHDILGHTLSVIILKTDLAARLAHQNPDRVVAELADVDRIARDTLEEVRQTLRGYRARSLEHEFELARSTLEIAGLTVTTEFAPPELTPPQENVLCLALREAVTNVVKHSQAKTCRLSTIERNGICQLEIEDDGQAQEDAERKGVQSEGQGLRGMRERVEASGGTLLQRRDKGTRLIIRLPLITDAKATA